MAERSRFWNSTGPGDASEAPYDAPTEFAQVMMAAGDHAGAPNRGLVISSVAVTGLLEPTNPGANTLRIATGEAFVYGTWYQNDANVDVTIPTPGGATRIDRVVLRKSWASQTIRVTRIAGAEGGGAPSLVQTVGTTWDFPLAQVSITTGGVMTVTDERVSSKRNIGFLFQAGNITGPEQDPNALNRPVWRLDAAVTEQVFGIVPVPKEYVLNSTLTFRIRYHMQSATSGNVRLQLVMGFLSGTAYIGESSVLLTDAVPAVAGDIKEIVVTALTPPTSYDQWIYFRVQRQGGDGADTATGDMCLFATAEIEYQSYM